MGNPGFSPSGDKGIDCSPGGAGVVSIAMALREGSLNQRVGTPTRSSVVKPPKRRNTLLTDNRQENRDQSRYIEHIESQLASALAKIEALNSPKANKMRSAKLRVLTAENRTLRAENTEWTAKAEDMVLHERLTHAVVEKELRSRLDQWREDLEVKDARIADLEREIESVAAKFKEAEGLVEANVNLEKRIDMLTNMLVESPRKAAPKSTTTSPRKPVLRCTPRPTSMGCQMPPPPVFRQSIASVTETPFWDSKSQITSSMPNTPETNTSELATEGKEDVLETHAHPSMSSSRPASFMSTSSTETPSWEARAHSGSEIQSVSKHRRMRRFPSGSGSLKPLILPSASSINSLPASAPIFQSIDNIAGRKNLELEEDPMALAYLTGIVDNQPDDTPTLSRHTRSSAWAHEQTLKALEGRRSPVALRSPRRSSLSPKRRADLQSIRTTGLSNRLQRPRNLQSELEDIEGDGLSQLQFSLEREVPPEQLECEKVPDPGDGEQDPVKTDPKRSTQATAYPEDTTNFISRLTGTITRTRQDPVDLARRILYNAWNLGYSSLGGIAWWLVGPLHHHRQTSLLGASKANALADGGRYAHFGARGQRCHHNTHLITPRTAMSTGKSTPGIPSPTRSEPHLFPCAKCQEPSSRRTIRLWFHFCLTVVLAVGMAVRHGPAALVAEIPAPSAGKRDYEKLLTDMSHHKHNTKPERESSQLCSPSRSRHPKSYENGVRGGGDSGYGSSEFTGLDLETG